MQFSVVSFFVKMEVCFPLTVAIAADAGRYSLSAVILTLLLGVLLTIFEHNLKGNRLVCASGLATVLASAAEMLILKKNGLLHGPVEQYGLINTLLVISILCFAFGIISSWADRKKVAINGKI